MRDRPSGRPPPPPPPPAAVRRGCPAAGRVAARRVPRRPRPGRRRRRPCRVAARHERPLAEPAERGKPAPASSCRRRAGLTRWSVGAETDMLELLSGGASVRVQCTRPAGRTTSLLKDLDGRVAVISPRAYAATASCLLRNTRARGFFFPWSCFRVAWYRPARYCWPGLWTGLLKSAGLIRFRLGSIRSYASFTASSVIGHVELHGVAVEVGVEPLDDQRAHLEHVARHQLRPERHDAEPVQHRRPVDVHRAVAHLLGGRPGPGRSSSTCRRASRTGMPRRRSRRTTAFR
jgi:hypothetical protein